MPTDEELRERYPEVELFAVRMRQELWANHHKGDHWTRMTPRQAWGEIAWHVGKLTAALKAEDASAIRELAADVANGAMMLDDIIGLMLGSWTPHEPTDSTPGEGTP